MFQRLIAAVVSLALVLPALATDWYVDSGITGADAGGITGYDTSDGHAGNDSNAGTATAPFLTLGKLQSVIQNGDHAYLAGRFRTANATANALLLQNASSMTFEQWPGRAPADIRGDNLIPLATTWVENADAGGSSWTTSTAVIATGLTTLADCCWDYDLAASIDPQGRHVTHFKRVASAAATKGANTQGTYFYDTATGKVTVHPPFDADPTGTFQISYSVRGRNGFKFTDTGSGSGGITVRGIRFTAWADGTSGVGYAYQAAGHAGDLIENCDIIDAGYHGVGFPGGRCVNNISRNNRYVCQAAGGVCIAFYAGTGTVSGCVSSGDTFYINSFIGMDPDGTIADATTNGDLVAPAADPNYNGAVITHGAPGASGVTVLNPRVRGYTPYQGSNDNIFAPFYTGATFTGTISDSPYDYTRYPLIIMQTDPSILCIDECSQQNSQSSIAFVNCRMRFSNFGAVGSVRPRDWCFGNNPTGSAAYILLYGCEVAVNQNEQGEPTAVYGGQATGGVSQCRMYLLNTSTLDYSTTNASGSASSHAMFAYSDSSLYVIARRSIFAFRATAAAGNNERRFCSGDGAVAAGNHDFQDCMYWNVTAAKYSANTSFDTSAEWFVTIDPNGFELALQPFADVTGSTDLLLRTTGVAWEATNTRQPIPSRGSDGEEFSGRYGARQRPSKLVPSSNRTSVIQR